jgi:hypothetical protein
MRRDIGILELVDAVPSLDPFLLREHLRDHKITPDQCYFAISDADQRRMFEFASKEVQRLTDLALGEQAAHQMSDRMVSAMLSGTVNGPLDPLRTTLDLAPAQFAEGVFGWRGFLYYKWKLQGFWTDVIDVLKQVHTVRPVGTFGADTADRIACIKRVLVNGVKAESAHVHEVIGIYDAAYSGLVESHDPREFRGFLLEAPALLPGIGETIGAISHFTSFWHSRFPAASPGSIDAFELMVILQDFADSLGIPIEQDRRQLRRH